MTVLAWIWVGGALATYALDCLQCEPEGWEYLRLVPYALVWPLVVVLVMLEAIGRQRKAR